MTAFKYGVCKKNMATAEMTNLTIASIKMKVTCAAVYVCAHFSSEMSLITFASKKKMNSVFLSFIVVIKVNNSVNTKLSSEMSLITFASRKIKFFFCF